MADQTYIGWTGNISAGLAPAEIHAIYSKTDMVYTFNVFDVVENVLEGIERW